MNRPAYLEEQRYLLAHAYAERDYVDDLERHDPILALRWHRKAARKGGARENLRYGELLQKVVSPVFLPADRAPVALKAAA